MSYEVAGLVRRAPSYRALFQDWGWWFFCPQSLDSFKWCIHITGRGPQGLRDCLADAWHLSGIYVFNSLELGIWAATLRFRKRCIIFIGFYKMLIKREWWTATEYQALWDAKFGADYDENHIKRAIKREESIE